MLSQHGDICMFITPNINLILAFAEDVYSEDKKECTLTSLYLIHAEIANSSDPAREN